MMVFLLMSDMTAMWGTHVASFSATSEPPKRDQALWLAYRVRLRMAASRPSRVIGNIRPPISFLISWVDIV